MKTMHMIAYTLLFIGGLNWGLIGLFNLNLVMLLFGAWPSVVMLVYILVGVAAVYVAATHMSDCMMCAKMAKKKKR